MSVTAHVNLKAIQARRAKPGNLQDVDTLDYVFHSACSKASEQSREETIDNGLVGTSRGNQFRLTCSLTYTSHTFTCPQPHPQFLTSIHENHLLAHKLPLPTPIHSPRPLPPSSTHHNANKPNPLLHKRHPPPLHRRPHAHPRKILLRPSPLRTPRPQRTRHKPLPLRQRAKGVRKRPPRQDEQAEQRCHPV